MKTPINKNLRRKRRNTRTAARVNGTAERPRLVVFRSRTNIYAQLVDDAAGKTLASASDMKEKARGMSSAEAVGKAIAAEAKKAKISACVFDRNGYKYHGRVKALAEAAREGGLNF